ncbi:MAG: hypothetical protein VYC34_06535, partial [Planctomycetota bacterium]|nr:hypothetical protein [Planctomycetota bacterium]
MRPLGRRLLRGPLVVGTALLFGVVSAAPGDAAWQQGGPDDPLSRLAAEAATDAERMEAAGALLA